MGNGSVQSLVNLVLSAIGLTPRTYSHDAAHYDEVSRKKVLRAKQPGAPSLGKLRSANWTH